jgi:hypothetical protein
MQNIDMWLDTTREFLHRIAAFIPLLVVGIVVILVGWLFAKAVRFAVEKALRAVNFNVLTERAGTDHFLRQGGLQGDTTTLFGIFAFWVVIIAALIIAFNVMGLTYITDLLQRVELFMPKVLVAMLVVVLGSYFAKFIGEAVHTYCVDAQIPDSDILGRLARYLIMTFVIMIALSQIEVGGDIVQRTFLIILGGLVLAFALAFGLGGKEWAATMLERWWPQRRKDDR